MKIKTFLAGALLIAIFGCTAPSEEEKGTYESYTVFLTGGGVAYKDGFFYFPTYNRLTNESEVSVFVRKDEASTDWFIPYFVVDVPGQRIAIADQGYSSGNEIWRVKIIITNARK